jgi:hypothetical protein
MRASTLRRLAATAATALLGMLALAGASQGAAETGSFGPFQVPFNDTVDDTGTCLGTGATGTISGVDTVVGRFTENGPPTLGFHDHGTVTSVYRVSYSDGRYVLGTDVEGFNDNATNNGQMTSTVLVHGSGSLYAADGRPLGSVGVQTLFHLSFRDANGDHEPDPGEVSSSRDGFRLTCD